MSWASGFVFKGLSHRKLKLKKMSEGWLPCAKIDPLVTSFDYVILGSLSQ